MTTWRHDRHRSGQRPRSANSAGTVSVTAATLTRASTAPAGDQPAPISAAPNVPDVPKHIADSSPSPMPAPWPARPARSARLARVQAPVAGTIRSSAARTVGIRLLLVTYAGVRGAVSPTALSVVLPCK